MPKPRGHLYRNGLPLRILYQLEADGGWLTLEGLGLVIPGAQLPSLQRALLRLRSRGMVEDRRVDLIGAVPKNRPDGEPGMRVKQMGESGHRAEWRVEWRYLGGLE